MAEVVKFCVLAGSIKC